MNAPFLRFRPLDILEEGGQQFRFLSATRDGVAWINLEDPEDLRTYSHVEFMARLKGPGIRIRREEHLPGGRRARLRVARRYIGTMPPQPRGLLLWKLAWAQGFLALERQGKVRRVGLSIASRMSDLEALVGRRSERQRKRAGALLPPQRQSPSARTLLTWVRALEAADGSPLALARRPGSGGHGRRLPLEVERIIAEQIDGFYLTRQAPTIANLIEQVKDVLDATNEACRAEGRPCLPRPSARSIRRRLGKLDPFEVAVQRHGSDFARRKFGFYERGLRTEVIGERVEMDEWNIDLLAFLDMVGVEGLTAQQRAALQVVRLWMVAAIDCASRCMLAYKLCLTPRTEEALSTLEMIGRNKTDLALACGCECRWDQASGVGVLATDMGPSFANDAFVMAVTDLGWSWMAAAAGNPELRGTIERAFRTFGYLLMPLLTGRTFGNPRERGDYPSEQWAALNEDELVTIFTRFIVDIYHNRPHAGLAGETPANAWTRLMAERGYLAPPDETLRRAVFGLEVTSKLDRHGLRFAGINYVSDRLRARLLHGHQREFALRVDPHDLGWVVVQLGDEWYPLQATNPAVEGLSYEDWREMVLEIRRKHRTAAELTEGIIRRARESIMAGSAAARARHRLGGLKVTPALLQKDKDGVFLGLVVRDEIEGAPLLAPPGEGHAGDLLDREIPSEPPAHEPPVNRPPAQDPLPPAAEPSGAKTPPRPPRPWRFDDEPESRED